MKKAILTLTELFAIGKPSIDKLTGITDGVFFIGDDKEGELFKRKIEGLKQEEISGAVMIDSCLDELRRCEKATVTHEDVCEYFRVYHTERQRPEDLMAHNFR